MSMKWSNPNTSQADNIGNVNRQRTLQDNLQRTQEEQMQAAERIQSAIVDFRSLGTTDVHAAVVGEVKQTMKNALDLSQQTAERALEVVKGQKDAASTADGNAQNAGHDLKLISNVGKAVDTVLSGKQAENIKIALVNEEQHQSTVRDTSHRNANELSAHTREAVEHTKDRVAKVLNTILP